MIVAIPVGRNPKNRTPISDRKVITVARSEKINEIGAIIKAANKSAPALNDKLETVCGDLLVIIEPVA